MAHSLLGQLLVEEGLLTENDRITINKTSGHYPASFAKGIISLGVLDELELSALIADYSDYEVAPESLESIIDERALHAIDKNLIQALEILPVSFSEDSINVAMADPLDRETVKQLEFFTGRQITPLITPFSDLWRSIKSVIPEFEAQHTDLEKFLANHFEILNSPPGIETQATTDHDDLSASDNIESLDDLSEIEELSDDMGDDIVDEIEAATEEPVEEVPVEDFEDLNISDLKLSEDIDMDLGFDDAPSDIPDEIPDDLPDDIDADLASETDEDAELENASLDDKPDALDEALSEELGGLDGLASEAVSDDADFLGELTETTNEIEASSSTEEDSDILGDELGGLDDLESLTDDSGSLDESKDNLGLDAALSADATSEVESISDDLFSEIDDAGTPQTDPLAGIEDESTRDDLDNILGDGETPKNLSSSADIDITALFYKDQGGPSSEGMDDIEINPKGDGDLDENLGASLDDPFMDNTSDTPAEEVPQDPLSDDDIDSLFSESTVDTPLQETLPPEELSTEELPPEELSTEELPTEELAATASEAPTPQTPDEDAKVSPKPPFLDPVTSMTALNQARTRLTFVKDLDKAYDVITLALKKCGFDQGLMIAKESEEAAKAVLFYAKGDKSETLAGDDVMLAFRLCDERMTEKWQLIHEQFHPLVDNLLGERQELWGVKFSKGDTTGFFVGAWLEQFPNNTSIRNEIVSLLMRLV